ncbi:MAG: glycosyltransferase family 2 protein [Candidatus Azambacteria bacterium]|nr:glycosyltransferase family 2 protein [Candidatus Azambacteria bacterium]
MEHPVVSVNLVVQNGEKYIRACLRSVQAQTYPAYEVIVFDNNSTDATRTIVEQEFPEFRLIANPENLGFGPGQNMCLTRTQGKYVLGLCVDVVLDENFITHAVETMEHDAQIGALQAKIFRLEHGEKTDVIDTTGFVIFKSRRVINRGHGEKDVGQYDVAEEVFSYEGAVPFWRREALEKSSVFGEVHDEDYFWYADDIDLGWRLRLFGWKSYYTPRVIAYHDRSTTKRLRSGWRDFIALRRTIPMRKRTLDWQNQHFTFIKNDFVLSALKDIRYILSRECMLFCYIIIYEPYTLRAIPRMLRLFPRMLRKRRYIMKHKKVTRREIERWFIV